MNRRKFLEWIGLGVAGAVAAKVMPRGEATKDQWSAPLTPTNINTASFGRFDTDNAKQWMNTGEIKSFTVDGVTYYTSVFKDEASGAPGSVTYTYTFDITKDYTVPSWMLTS